MKSNRSLRLTPFEVIVAMLLFGLWSFVLYLQVSFVVYRLFPIEGKPAQGGAIAWGIGIIAATIGVALTAGWLARRLNPIAWIVIHIPLMLLTLSIW